MAEWIPDDWVWGEEPPIDDEPDSGGGGLSSRTIALIGAGLFLLVLASKL